MLFRLVSGAVTAAAIAISAPAAAATLVGSAAVSMVGVTADTPSIDVGTTFTNSSFSVVGTAFGDFMPVIGEQILASSLTAQVGEAFSFTSDFGSFSGVVESASSEGSSDERTVRAFVLGLFTPMGVLGGFDAGPASATFAFSQTGVESAVSGSFTIASPPAGAIPEPATWAMLIAGFGLVGFAARRRRTLAASTAVSA